MIHRLQIITALAAITALAVACSPARFSSDQVEKSSNAASNEANPDLPGLDDVGRDLPSPADPVEQPEPPHACNFPIYSGPYNSPEKSECHSTSYTFAQPKGASVTTGQTIRFRMYNASNLSHGLVPATHRYLATQKIALAGSLAPESVDLVLSSYEPVLWQIIGNSAAVRSVHVDGYHCAQVEGVDSARVRIQTYEQGVIESSSALLPLSNNLGLDISIYEGSCLPGNTLSIP